MEAEGIISDEELPAVHRQLKSEEGILNGHLEEFSGEPSPPVRDAFERLAAYWRGDVVVELDAASDELRAKFVELFEPYVVVFPSRDHRFDITANIPPEMEGYTVSAHDMVFSPSRGEHRGRGSI